MSEKKHSEGAVAIVKLIAVKVRPDCVWVKVASDPIRWTNDSLVWGNALFGISE
jgi:hypothetical protein